MNRWKCAEAHPGHTLVLLPQGHPQPQNALAVVHSGQKIKINAHMEFFDSYFAQNCLETLKQQCGQIGRFIAGPAFFNVFGRRNFEPATSRPKAKKNISST